MQFVYENKEPWSCKTKWNKKCKFFSQILITEHKQKSPPPSFHICDRSSEIKQTGMIFSSDDDNNDL